MSTFEWERAFLEKHYLRQLSSNKRMWLLQGGVTSIDQLSVQDRDSLVERLNAIEKAYDVKQRQMGQEQGTRQTAFMEHRKEMYCRSGWCGLDEEESIG